MTGADADALASWGATAILLPVAQDLGLHGDATRSSAAYLELVDEAIRVAAEAGLYSIVQLGTVTATAPRLLPWGELEVGPGIPDEGSKELWATLAARYSGEPAVLFDLFRAPRAPLPGETVAGAAPVVTWQLWRAWLLALLGEVRAAHPAAVVFLRGLHGGVDLSGFPMRRSDRKVPENLVYAGAVAGAGYLPMLDRFARLLKGKHAVAAVPWTMDETGAAVIEAVGQGFARRGIHWLAGAWRSGDAPLVQEQRGVLVPTIIGRSFRRAFSQPASPKSNLGRRPSRELPGDGIADALSTAATPAVTLTEVTALTPRELALVRAALPLADSPDHVAELLFVRRFARRPGRRPVVAPRVATGLSEQTDADLVAADATVVGELRVLIQPEVTRYDELVEAEFALLAELPNKLIFRSFLPLNLRKGEYDWLVARPEAARRAALPCYRERRPAYCRFGYSRPFEQVFSRLQTMNLFEKKTVLVQPELKALLDQLSAKMSGPEFQQVKRWLTLAGGFVPRFIDGTTRLSDHAFGLAVDVNWETNPEIKDKKEHKLIPIVKHGTRGAPSAPNGFDFGTLLVDEKAVPDPVQRARRIHALVREASDVFTTWLAKTVEAAARHEREIAAARDAVRALEIEMLQPTLVRSLTVRAAHVAAVDVLATRERALAENADQQQLRALRAAKGDAVVEQWRLHGIRDLPLELVVACKQVEVVVASKSLRLIWGDEWEKKKDGMHFDLGNVREVLVPDAPERTLYDLLTEMP